MIDFAGVPCMAPGDVQITRLTDANLASVNAGSPSLPNVAGSCSVAEASRHAWEERRSSGVLRDTSREVSRLRWGQKGEPVERVTDSFVAIK